MNPTIKTKMKWIKIKNKGIEITNEQQFNGLSYLEILKKVKESEIADYPLLQELRNRGYKFLKEFWVFVPNPDKISKKNKFAARFNANSDWAVLDCDWNRSYAYSSLGVFLIRKIEGKK